MRIAAGEKGPENHLIDISVMYKNNVIQLPEIADIQAEKVKADNI